jgi:hypothetical protein
MSKIYEDFHLFRDKHGLNQINTAEGKGVTSQNGTLFTMQYLLCLLASDEASEAEKISEVNRVSALFKSLEVGKGLTVRYPRDREFESMDNSSAILTFSAVFDNGRFAKDMRERGRTQKCEGYDDIAGNVAMNKKFYPLALILGLGRPRNYFNNNRPSYFCFFGWFGRSPGFMGLIDIASKGSTTWFRHIALLVGQFLGSSDPASNTDARTMSYIIWQFLKDKSFIHKMLYKVWTKKLYKVYPDGMSEVYNIYYKNRSHPLVIYTNQNRLEEIRK